MRKIKFRGDNLDDLLDYVSTFYGGVANTIKEINGKKIGFFVDEKYYLRSNASASCSILYYRSDQNTCELDIAITGGYSGFLGINLGAKSHMESITAGRIIKHAIENLKLEKTSDSKEEDSKRCRFRISYPYWPPPDK